MLPCVAVVMHELINLPKNTDTGTPTAISAITSVRNDVQLINTANWNSYYKELLSVVILHSTFNVRCVQGCKNKLLKNHAFGFFRK